MSDLTGEQQRERRRKLRRFAQLMHQIGGVEAFAAERHITYEYAPEHMAITDEALELLDELRKP